MFLYGTSVGFIESHDKYIKSGKAVELDHYIVGLYLQGVDLDEIFIKNGEVHVKNESV